MSKITVLIGHASSYKSISICKYIANNYNNINIYTYDTISFINYFKTKYSKKHFCINKKEYYLNLEELILHYKIDIFIPVISDDINYFWKNKDKLGNSLNYLGDYNSYLTLNDKYRLSQLAIKLKIKIPTIYDSKDKAEIPFVIKPTNLSSSRGVIYVKNIDKKKRLFFIDNNTIIQQYIEGVGVGYSFYCKDGKILNSYGHKRIAEFPISGGSSTYREEYVNQNMHIIALKIVKKLNYTGFAMLEFKLTEKNELYLIEVNPRIWGSINQGLVNKTNYFENILGKNNAKEKYINNNIRTYLSPLIYLSLLMYFFKFNFRPIKYFLINFNENIPDINFIDDPLGFISTIIRKLYNE